MKKLNLAVLAMCALSVPAFAQGAPQAMKLPAPVKGKGPAKAAHYPKSLVKRGEYLVAFGGCNDCHTPMEFDPQAGGPVPDMARMLSGHPEGGPVANAQPQNGDMAVIGPTFTSFNLPFGVVYSANLTPDVDTGIGSWTEKMFVDAIRKGRHMGGNGRAILPPMPWQDVDQLSTNDLKAIFAYLRTVPPIHNAVPAPKVPPPVLDAMAKANDGFVQMMEQMHHHAPKKMTKKATKSAPKK